MALMKLKPVGALVSIGMRRVAALIACVVLWGRHGENRVVLIAGLGVESWEQDVLRAVESSRFFEQLRAGCLRAVN